MCGFAGFFAHKTHESYGAVLKKMSDTIIHRGPNDSGVWFDTNYGIGLCHRRLSVVDLSSAGQQPMKSPSNRYVISFNGEIYNHKKLRMQLENNTHKSLSWRGHSDTETFLACIEAWGLEAALKNSVGMFAFALWDRYKKCLFIARDRMGEKPLYYGWQKNVFLFGSELKALKAHPAFVGEINRNALTLLLRYNYIPAPFSIYKGINKLLPGTFLKIDIHNSRNLINKILKPTTYWTLKSTVKSGISNLFSGGDNEAINELDKLLGNSVSQQMEADVPLGAFLSGGIDSSTIIALMQKNSCQQIKTFTIGFSEDGYNEAEYAKQVARYLGTEHTELYVTSKEAMNIIPRLPELYDEPFSDSSQIPTFLVSHMTRQHVTVSLSGDGGDELFGGYNRYVWANRVWRKYGILPLTFRNFLAKRITTYSPEVWNKILGGMLRVLPSDMRVNMPGDKMHKLADVLVAKTPEDIYHGLISHWTHPSEIVMHSSEPQTILTENTKLPELSNFEHRMMYLDSMSYLPEDILTKVDRASMGVSLETRIPFLDQNIVEFAWKLPLSMKIRDGQGKWILRQVLKKYIPSHLIDRPKMGFGVPIGIWLRGPLFEWAENLLDESRLKQEGYFEPKLIRKIWSQHLKGHRNWQHHLWSILMFQSWLEYNN